MKVLARRIGKYIIYKNRKIYSYKNRKIYKIYKYISEVYPMEKDQTVQDSTGNSLQVEKYLLCSGPQIFILWGT